MKSMSLVIALLSALFSQESLEFSGYIKADYKAFKEDGLYADQEKGFASLAFQPKMYTEWANGDQTLNMTLFARYDQHDENRTHFDVRELYWQYIAETWELSIGLKKIYWGVIESKHLVDVINQTDFVESFDGEEKLGQPMLHYSYPSDDYGTFDAFIMPYFRERVFPSAKGRLRFPFDIKESNATFESDNKKKQVDLALRWSHSFDILDLGIAHFSGTNRDPSINFATLAPHYMMMEQTSIDAQLTTDDILYKFELIRRDMKALTYTAASAGAEYTFGNVSNTGTDIGILVEYHFDDRLPSMASFANNDIFLGSRVALNDEQSLEFLIGSIIDIDNQSQLFSVEGSRRLGDSFKLNVEVRMFSGIDEKDQLFAFRDDSFVQLSLAKFF